MAVRGFIIASFLKQGFPGDSDYKESACNSGDLGSILGSRRSHGEGDGNQATPIFLSGESHGQRSPAGYGPWGHKELDMIEQLTLFLK